MQAVTPTRWSRYLARGLRCVTALASCAVFQCSSGQPAEPPDAGAGDLDAAPDILTDVQNLRDGPIALCAAPDPGETSGAGGSCSAPRRMGTPYGCIDRHCLVEGGSSIAIPVNTSLCSKPSGGAGASPEGGEPPLAFESDDAECKFHVQLAMTCAGASDLGVTFTLTKLIDGMPALGAAPYVAAYLSITHFAPSAGTTAEGPSGLYTISHIQLDASGIWTLEFHLYASCPLETSSPHAHFTTFLEVP